MMAARALAAVAMASALGAAGASCSGRPDATGRRLPPAPASLTVTMADFYFVHANRAPAGRVVFEVTNAGRFPHRLSLFRLDDAAPPARELPWTGPDRPGAALAVMPVLAPDESGTFAVDLVAGARYAMASLIAGPDGVPDAQRGMVTELRAAARSTGAGL
ncbi:MAG: hypothetical protein ACT4OS_09115 [Acidimicrobiales bacterium]